MHQFRAQYPPHFTSMVPYYISPSACLNCASMYPAVSYPGPLHDYMPASNSIPAVGANSLSHISLPPTKNIPATGAFSIPPVGQPSPASPPSLEQATGLAVPKSTTPPSQPLPMKYTAQSSSREAFTRGNKIMPTVKLHVNGLSNDDTEKDLEELFSPHCTVLGMSAAKHHLGYRMGSVVVPGHEADGAIFALNGIKRGGLKLKVERWSDELEKKGFLKRNGAPKTSAIPPKENQKEVQNGAKAAQSAPAAPKAFVPKPEHGWANFAQKAQEVFGTNGTGTRSPCSSGRSSPVLPIPKVRKNAGVLGAPTAPLSMRLQAQAESVITGLSQQSKSGSPGAPPKLSRAQKKRLKKLELESSNNDFAGLTAKFSSMSVSRQQSEQNQAAVAANTAVAAVPALHQPLQQPSPKLLPMQPTDLETLLAQRIESKTFLPKGVNDLVEISTFEGRSESSGSAAKARNRAETTQSEYLIDF